MIIFRQIFIFFRILLNEFINPFNYIFAIAVGITLNLVHYKNILEYTPYVLTLLILIIFQSFKNYKNRHLNLLKKLPEYKTDPVFVINNDGKILESCGLTKKLLDKEKIEFLNHLFNNRDIKLIFSKIEKTKGSKIPASFELYSEYLKQWYRVNVRKINEFDTNLIWMFDINARKSLDYSFSSVSEFFSFVKDNNQNGSNEKIVEKIPMVLLQEGYNAVYIATKDQYGILGGYIYKNKNDMFLKSDYITLHEGKSLLNHDKFINGEIFHWKKDGFESSIESIENHLSNQITGFLDCKINDLLSYHDNSISVVCINKDLGTFESDRKFLKIIVDIAYLSFKK